MVTQNVVIHILCSIYIHHVHICLASVMHSSAKCFTKKGWEVNFVYGFDLAQSILDIVILWHSFNPLLKIVSICASIWLKTKTSQQKCIYMVVEVTIHIAEYANSW